MRHLNARTLAVAALGVSIVAVTGCGTFKKTLGLEKRPPDEFTVVSRAPLSMPPNLDLRPPRPGETAASSLDTVEDARRNVFQLGETQQRIPVEAASPGEAALLGRAGVNRSQPNIRTVLDEENQSIIAAEKSVTDTLLFWREDPEPPATVVDASAERERLQRNRSLGLPPTEGEVPSVVENEGRGGLLESLF